MSTREARFTVDVLPRGAPPWLAYERDQNGVWTERWFVEGIYAAPLDGLETSAIMIAKIVEAGEADPETLRDLYRVGGTDAVRTFWLRFFERAP